MCLCDPTNRGPVCNDCRPQWNEQLRLNAEIKINSFPADKQKKLARALYEFKNTEKTASDYIQLFYIVNNVLQQGSGLNWMQVGEVVEYMIDGKPPEEVKIIEKNVPTRYIKTAKGEIKLSEVLEAIENLECGTTEFYDKELREYFMDCALVVSNGHNSYIPTEKLEDFAKKLREIHYDQKEIHYDQKEILETIEKSPICPICGQGFIRGRCTNRKCKTRIYGSRCPLCGKELIFSKDEHACSDIECKFGHGIKNVKDGDK